MNRAPPRNTGGRYIAMSKALGVKRGGMGRINKNGMSKKGPVGTLMSSSEKGCRVQGSENGCDKWKGTESGRTFWVNKRRESHSHRYGKAIRDHNLRAGKGTT